MAEQFNRQMMVDMVHSAQDNICDALSAFDGDKFHEDKWQRPAGGGGRTRVMQDGQRFEKAGVNVSVVHGALPEFARRSMLGAHQDDALEGDVEFFATGISMVLHPHNPMAPTFHANYRYFELQGQDDKTQPMWWFGGGADLTPSYLFEEDAQHFHRTLRDACQCHDVTFYPKFKAWCDEYFRIRHRGESRGVGGVFFDRLNDRSATELFAFVSQMADVIVPSYLPLVQRRCDMDFTAAQRRWQQIRRGRYAEFNLIYDRGTQFGLQTNGRVESILMSLPLTARWEYDAEKDIAPESREGQLLEVLREPRQWV